MKTQLLIVTCLLQLSSASCASGSRGLTEPNATMVNESTRTPANAGKACFPQAGQNCLVMPGLEEGQRFRLKTDIDLDGANSWRYFANGAPIAGDQLVKNIGQTYCAVTAVNGSTSWRKHKMNRGRYALSEISWYVNSILLKNEQDHMAVYCSTVDEQFTAPGVTSAAAIQKDLHGVIELLP